MRLKGSNRGGGRTPGSRLDLFGNYVSAQVGEFKIAQIARF